MLVHKAVLVNWLRGPNRQHSGAYKLGSIQPVRSGPRGGEKSAKLAGCVG